MKNKLLALLVLNVLMVSLVHGGYDEVRVNYLENKASMPITIKINKAKEGYSVYVINEPGLYRFKDLVLSIGDTLTLENPSRDFYTYTPSGVNAEVSFIIDHVFGVTKGIATPRGSSYEWLG